MPLFAPLIATAAATAPAGFTVGKSYSVISMGIDCLPAAPVLYVMLIDDTGTLRTIPIGPTFTYRVFG